MSYTDLERGELAAAVTYLEMHEPPAGEIPESALSLVRIDDPDADSYRSLFRRVGSRWLWFSRLAMNDEALLAIIADPKVELYSVADENGRTAGMLELDFRENGECELAFIGLVPDLAGMGHGRWLLAEAVRRAWRDGVRRVHVHSCTLDHPAALGAYRRAGFKAYKRGIERFADPRLNGILPADCAPQVPLVGTETAAGGRPLS